MPSKTLEDKPLLLLPSIQVEQTAPIEDGPVLTQPHKVFDDPAHPETSRVHWISEKEMSFDIKPEDNFPTGVFTTTVTNPDGKSSTKFAKPVAVIPKPEITMVQPPTLCIDESDDVFTITGKYFLTFNGTEHPTVTVSVGPPDNITKTYQATVVDASCNPVMADLAETDVKLCTDLTFTVPAADFPVTMPTIATITVTNPAPADCSSSEDITVSLNLPPRVDSAVPSNVCEGGTQITVHGSGFVDGATASLNCNGTITQATSTVVSPDGMTITATFPAVMGATVGDMCDLIITNPDGCEDRPLPHKQVMIVPGPILFFVDPPVVFNGINTRITLYATTITPPLPADAVTMVPSGQTMPVTQLDYNTVANHPNRLQAVIPMGQAPGTYDITLRDASGCLATLAQAIIVTSDLTVSLRLVDPPFGATASDTAITIYRDTMAAPPANLPFIATPRAFLNPANPMPTDIAVEVENVAFRDGNTATGVVPAGTPPAVYDLVLVNPDGSVGLLSNAYTELATAPPVILTATPSSIPASSGQVIVLRGTDFDAGAMVTFDCRDASGMPVPAPTVVSQMPVCNGSDCTQTITVDASTLSAGDVCVVRITNSDGSYFEYSAVGVTTPSLNLNSPVSGRSMITGRRGLVAASGDATFAARFLYAIGGDDGQTTGALNTSEFIDISKFGQMGIAWTPQRSMLNSPRTLAASATVGRYIYLVGGDDGTGPLATAERALILSPRETPVIEDVDLVLGMVGPDPGEWHYRVSAIFDANDTDIPGGESLASDPFTLRIPTFTGKKIAVTLVWKAPVDSLGMPVPGVAGYRIYRSPAANAAPNSEVLLATVNSATTLTYTDDGMASPGTETPLPLGSTGTWYRLPNMAAARSGVAVAAGFDPASPDTFYVYALLGLTSATTAEATYEYLPVTIAANGRQTTAGAWTAGAQQSSTARWQHSAWVATSTVSTLITPPDTYIYIGGGRLGNGALTGIVEAGLVSAGGDLGALDDLPKDFTSTAAGYGACAANGQLFVFGGAGGMPSSQAKSAQIVNPIPSLAANAWNNEGLSTTHGRYLMGSTVQSAFIFLLGGQTDEPSAASQTTELVIW